MIPSSVIDAAFAFLFCVSPTPRSLTSPDGDADLLSAGDTGCCPNGRNSDWYSTVGAVVLPVVVALAEAVEGDRSPVVRRTMAGAGAGGVPGIPGTAGVVAAVVVVVVVVVAAVGVSTVADRVSMLLVVEDVRDNGDRGRAWGRGRFRASGLQGCRASGLQGFRDVFLWLSSWCEPL